jgi:hypothetical protein
MTAECAVCNVISFTAIAFVIIVIVVVVVVIVIIIIIIMEQYDEAHLQSALHKKPKLNIVYDFKFLGCD